MFFYQTNLLCILNNVGLCTVPTKFNVSNIIFELITKGLKHDKKGPQYNSQIRF